MQSNQTNDRDNPPNNRRKRTCGLCGSQEHDRRKCPKRAVADPKNSSNSAQHANTPPPDSQEGTNSASKCPQSSPNTIIPTLATSVYVVLDLETTGFSPSSCNIIEIAGEILSPDGIPLEDGTYTSLIRPPTNIPRLIAEYNKYMGGVDLADMRRLHCNSTIMGQNRWWLKLFFYLLDVGTSNALVLYKSASARTDVFTIVNFKGYLVQAFLGNRLQSVPEAVVSHFPTSSLGRNRCVHCAIFSRVRRTRFHCSAPDCQLPLCSVGSGQGVQDCFSLCHGNPELLAAALIKYQAMKKKVNQRFK